MIFDNEKLRYIKVVALIAAGGQGKRMGTLVSKQYLKISNKPILAWTIENFEKSSIVDEIIIIGNEKQYILDIIKEYNFSKISEIAEGGRERQDSVYNGLRAIKDRDCVVIIHDGARPFITNEDIENTANKALEYEGCTLGVMVKDTIKQVDSSGIVEKTLERSKLRAIQTPQAFRYDIIKSAHDRAKEQNYVGTDDCSLIENFGGRVCIIEGSYRNIKITTPEDLDIAEKFIES